MKRIGRVRILLTTLILMGRAIPLRTAKARLGDGLVRRAFDTLDLRRQPKENSS